MKVILSKEQDAAATYRAGRSAILAGAGTGKTETISVRIARMINDLSIPDSEILATSFTRASARSLKERIDLRVGRRTKVQSGTLHSFCATLIRDHWARLPYEVKPSIVEKKDSETLLTQIAFEVTGHKKWEDIKTFSKEDLRDALSDYRTSLYSTDKRDLSPYLRSRRLPEAVGRIVRRYVETSERNGYIDFDAILFDALRLLKHAGDSLPLPRHVFIDEAQDLSAIQWFIIDELSKRAVSTVVIGDDDQAIYGWRGALPWRFREWAMAADHRFFLTENRRCARDITALAAEVVEQIDASRRIEKRIASARDERGSVRFSALHTVWSLDLVVSKIRAEVSAGRKTYADFAALARSTTHVFPILEGYLKAAGIPFRVCGGDSSFETEEARIVKLIGSLCTRPKGGREPGIVWSSLMYEIGVSPSAAENVVSNGIKMGGTIESFKTAIDFSRISETSKNALVSLMSLVRTVRESRGATFANVLQSHSLNAVINATVEKAVTASVDREKRTSGGMTDQQRAAKIQTKTGERLNALHQVFSCFAGESVEQAMLRLSLEKEDDVDDGSPKVTLSTVHSAKGLEWDTVFALESNAASWPSSRCGQRLTDREDIQNALDEERRLLYVAITRAKNELYLVSSSIHPVKDTLQDPSWLLPTWLVEAATPYLREAASSGASKGCELSFPGNAGEERRAGQTPAQDEMSRLFVERRASGGG